MSAISSCAAQPTRVAVRRITASRHAVALSGILALSAFLNLYKLTQNGYANTYYAAAVRSMLLSWHNFFFASFDPGGLVSVDKPPLALWVETASAKLFGFSSASILIPEALAGVASVGLLYLLVQRYFGRVAGLVAALALAISPVSVAINRDNNPDALFVLLLVAAAYVGARAIESGRLRTLLAAAALTGLAFEAKMLAAAIIVPGIALGYLAFTRVPWRRRIVHSALATSVLVVVSGAWIAAVQLTPAVDRPYVGSTSDNSALSLALGYNGLGRVDRSDRRHLDRWRRRRRVLGHAGLVPADQQRARRPGRLAAAARHPRRRLGARRAHRGARSPPAWHVRRDRRLVRGGGGDLLVLERDHPHLLPVGARTCDRRADRSRCRRVVA